jgi:hypothetical protein
MGMIAASAVVWKLKSVGAITALVGTRIFPGKAPPGAAYPYICVDRAPGQVSLGDHSRGQGSLYKSPVTAFCFAERDTGGIKQAGTIIELVRTHLCPTSSVTGWVEWNSTWIDHCTAKGQYEASVDPKEGDEVGWRAMALDVDVFHLNC